jgi:type IV secretory pathway TrbF-like protein
MKRYEIAAFIRNAKSVCSDPVVEQNMLNDLLAYARGAANKFLESYFDADDFAKNPFQIMKWVTSKSRSSSRSRNGGIAILKTLRDSTSPVITAARA